MKVTEYFLTHSLGYSNSEANSILKKFERMGVNPENVKVIGTGNMGRGNTPVQVIRWQRGFKLSEVIDALQSHLSTNTDPRVRVAKWKRLLKELECEQARL